MGYRRFLRRVQISDNGYREIEADGSVIDHLGTIAYYKIINADGTWKEYQRSDDDSSYYEILQNSDGYYREERCFENGARSNCVLIESETGIRQEEAYYENGQIKNYCYEDSPAGTLNAAEYFENGNLKYYKYQSPENTTEECFDADGYRTYFYNKTASVEIELTADDTGKLIKVVENGKTIEDVATLAQYAQSYNFRQ